MTLTQDSLIGLASEILVPLWERQGSNLGLDSDLLQSYDAIVALKRGTHCGVSFDSS